MISLPHTQLTDEYVSCAYTMKVLKFAKMMDSLGHKVYLYGSEDFETDHFNIESVTCITKKKQHEYFGNNDHKKRFYNITWGTEDPHWKHMNGNAIREIKKRIKPQDFIGIIGGVCQKEIADAFPNHMSVEYGIGYTGVFSRYKVFESWAHLHYVHGLLKNDNGDFYDEVIPNYYDTKEFPKAKKRGDYYLFIGRLIDRKGYSIAQQVCEKLGAKLILAGQSDGEYKGYGTHVGTVDAKQRGKLMSEAIAVFTPTTYLGPFEGTHAEANLCGTPVITTPFGVYSETVENGVNGFTCKTFKDFLLAAQEAKMFGAIDREHIRMKAQKRFGMEHVKHQYDDYFERLLDLWGDGWYTK